MSSAQLDTTHELLQPEVANPADSVPATLFALQETVALKEEVAARLAAHRARRQRNAPAAPTPIPIATPARARAARIAAAVAERYAHSESYRSFLATEAQNAIRQAEAVAEVAAVNARAIAEAQLNLLEELDQYSAEASANPAHQPLAVPELVTPSISSSNPSQLDLDRQPRITLDPSFPSASPAPSAVASRATKSSPAPQAPITVRLYEDVPTPLPQAFTTSYRHANLDPFDDENLALDDEIAFRQAPTFEQATPTTDIAANLIEFPRQLVAARRARPRIAEGPLREDSPAEASTPQLRIFEVEPNQISADPALDTAAPEWSSILLGAQPSIAPTSGATMVQAEEPAEYRIATAPILLTAPLELRIMAAAVDTALVLAAMLAFTTTAIVTIGSLPAVPQTVTDAFDTLSPLHPQDTLHAFGTIVSAFTPLALAAAAAFLFFIAAYQLLFFTFADTTPGMKYARIGLCTFSDDNPTRRQLRRRIPAMLLSACPLGLGLLWSWIDTDRLGWHDRLSRMYQRSY